MHVYTLNCELLLPVSMQEAFEVFEDPHNLARITPPWLGFRMLTGDVAMRRGARIEYSLRWCNLPFTWETLITDYEPPFHFVDEMVKGPYKMWKHRHTFWPTEAGTLVSDEVEYALPLGLMGRATHHFVVGKQLRDIFSYRQQALMEMLGTPSPLCQEPVIVER